ncbi:MAG TPA: YdeI/OmpD-associated family protein [Chitinophagaceae bacterium]|nr:YdeI/OmpD-associated family protein [Chitinophagaceae bacterium]
MAVSSLELKTYYARNRKAWRAWLLKHHAKSPGVWLIYYKKESGKPRVEYADAVEEALCFGWIDSTMRPLDEDRYMQRFTPRKPKSVWSALNKSRIEKLMGQGLMMPAGLEAIDTAKKNGSWTSIDHVENLEMPAALTRALNKNKAALKHFNQASRTYRKQVLYRINSAKLPETRARRIAEMVKMMGEGKKIF